MNLVNWKVRIRNKTFWVVLIPAVLVLINRVLAVFGIQFDATTIQNQLVSLVEALFAVLAILGIVVDPTTEGIQDSKQAMGYEKPRKDMISENE